MSHFPVCLFFFFTAAINWDDGFKDFSTVTSKILSSVSEWPALIDTLVLGSLALNFLLALWRRLSAVSGLIGGDCLLSLPWVRLDNLMGLSATLLFYLYQFVKLTPSQYLQVSPASIKEIWHSPHVKGHLFGIQVAAAILFHLVQIPGKPLTHSA